MSLLLKDPLSGSSLGTIAGTVVTASGANQTVSFDVTSAETKTLAPNAPATPYFYEVLATLASSSDLIPLQTGSLLILANGSPGF